MKYKGKLFRRFAVVIAAYSVLTALLLCILTEVDIYFYGLAVRFAVSAAGWCIGGAIAWIVARRCAFPSFSLILLGGSSAVFVAAEELLIGGMGIFLLPFFWLPAALVLSMLCPYFVTRFGANKKRIA